MMISETSSQDLLALRWPLPPRNLLVVKKQHTPIVEDAFIEFLKHVRRSYPSLSVILERDVAEQTHSRLEMPVYSTSEDVAPEVQLGQKVDLTTTLGGDGTILHAASLFSSARSVPPILSFSMGTLGFLGEWKFDEYKRAFRDVYTSGARSVHEDARITCAEQRSNPPGSVVGEKGYRTSSWSTVRGMFMGHGRSARVLLRNRLKVEMRAPFDGNLSSSQEHTHGANLFAMNEVIIHRGSDPHLAILDVHVGGRFLTEAVADGVIISSPTGSTAYSLSSGGSIVHPLVPSLLLTPICPRSLSFRPLVLPSNTPLTLRLSEKNRGRSLDVSIDGTKMKQGFCVGTEISVHAEQVKDAQGSWIGGVPCVVRTFPGTDVGSEDSWVGGLNALLKFNYPMGEA